MVERQDIDALLIGALYGELTPVEETRLAAHLESHPADRTALDDLTRAREVVAQSRILTFQYEPSQSISALLIQEAARRAPKKAAEGEGWFARFVRSFMQHPAMAAAAMLVVVIGAAAIVSRNTPEQFAETESVRGNSAVTAGRDPSPSLESKPTDNSVAAGSAAPSTGFQGPTQEFNVGLADGEATEGVAEKSKVAAAPEPKVDAPKAERPPNAKPAPNALSMDGFYDTTGGDSLQRKGAKQGKPADGALELRSKEPTPKELDDSKEATKDTGRVRREQAATQATTESLSPDSVAEEQQNYRAGNAAPGGAASGATAGAPAPVTTTAPATPPASPRNVPSPPPPPPAPTKTAPRAIAADSPTRDDKAANDPNLAWAKDQHAALVTAVRANNCGRAATLALSIANRAPAYYAQNVETDRSVKQCIAYINNEREKDAELRASRAKKSQLKNAEPAAPKRAADQPSRATSTDSTK